MMKQAFVVLALVGLAFSAPQPKKVFHENFKDFIDLIMDEAGHDIDHLLEHYMEFDEFKATWDYLQTNNFKDLVYEMEALPEFVAVVDFLENDNIDIHFFIDMINDALEESRMKRSARHQLSGTDFSAFINDVIGEFPKAKLSALFDEKMANDEEFSTAINNLQSDEWDQVFSALWESETFQKEVATLRENGVAIELILDEILAIFGQN
ncbi:protein G12-like [Anticarsia gemmatalis]|uniref:protein G12-like n=1 Tax=Anticarsia gemmatalis TaxID=129554 RepID=UPI003F757A7D